MFTFIVVAHLAIYYKVFNYNILHYLTSLIMSLKINFSIFFHERKKQDDQHAFFVHKIM